MYYLFIIIFFRLLIDLILILIAYFNIYSIYIYYFIFIYLEWSDWKENERISVNVSFIILKNDYY